jgi:hypothetical protein
MHAHANRYVAAHQAAPSANAAHTLSICFLYAATQLQFSTLPPQGMAGTQARAAELVHATDLSSGLASPDENGAATAAAGDGISYSYPPVVAAGSSANSSAVRAGRGRGRGER